jgi:hypothetical protein
MVLKSIKADSMPVSVVFTSWPPPLDDGSRAVIPSSLTVVDSGSGYEFP